MYHQNTYISVELEVTHNVAANTQYANNSEICLVNLGPIVPFSEAKFSNCPNKHLEKIENLHTVSLTQ